MAIHYILMGDVVSSRDYDQAALRREFMGLIQTGNETLKEQILSPYTVTLGDEFQGIPSSLDAAARSILLFEELAVSQKARYKIRYVTVTGEIDTPINPERAHTMMGPGLTRARGILTDKKRGTPRFRFELEGDVGRARMLNRLFLALDGIVARWPARDADLILDMLRNDQNDEVGERYGKNRAQIWKRRKTLQVEEYRALKEAILDVADGSGDC